MQNQGCAGRPRRSASSHDQSAAERAGRVLLVAGETVRNRTPETLYEMTAKTRRFGRVAGDGCTNPEMGAHLSISPHTGECNLRKVFTRLDIRSRKELGAALRYESDAGVPAQPATTTGAHIGDEPAPGHHDAGLAIPTARSRLSQLTPRSGLRW
jgi:hypothetical protein